MGKSIETIGLKNISIDFLNNEIQHLFVVQGDTKTRGLLVRIKDNNGNTIPASTEYELRLYAKYADEAKLLYSVADIVDEQYRVYLTTDMLRKVGTLIIQLALYKDNVELIQSKQSSLQVHPSMTCQIDLGEDKVIDIIKMQESLDGFEEKLDKLKNFDGFDGLDDLKKGEEERKQAERLRVQEETKRSENESTRKDNEDKRKESENQRESSESTRVDNEKQRVSNEEIRQANEEKRIASDDERKQKYELYQSNEEKRIEQENARASKEELRISEEQKRSEQESSRIKTEQERNSKEIERRSNEEKRSQQESERVQGEQTRISNEQTRTSNEQKREETEQARINAEEARKLEEQKRSESENSRVSQEQERQGNEKERQKHESTRVEAEDNRNSQEEIRKTNEEKRNSDEEDRENKETTRVQSEQERVTNEQTRVTNEKTRQEQEETRQKQEEERAKAEQQRSTKDSERDIKFDEWNKKIESLSDFENSKIPEATETVAGIVKLKGLSTEDDTAVSYKLYDKNNADISANINSKIKQNNVLITEQLLERDSKVDTKLKEYESKILDNAIGIGDVNSKILEQDKFIQAQDTKISGISEELSTTDSDIKSLKDTTQDLTTTAGNLAKSNSELLEKVNSFSVAPATSKTAGIVKLDVDGQDTAVSTKTYTDKISSIEKNLNSKATNEEVEQINTIIEAKASQKDLEALSSKLTELPSNDSVKNKNGSGKLSFWTGTQSQYDSLWSKDSNTIYFITE